MTDTTEAQQHAAREAQWVDQFCQLYGPEPVGFNGRPSSGWKERLKVWLAARRHDAEELAGLRAIEKELRGNVCDPDPLPGTPTTYGLASGLLRERDALKAQIERMAHQAATDKADRDYVFQNQQKAERERDALRAELDAMKAGSGEAVALTDMGLEISPISRGLWDGRPTVTFDEEGLLRYINRRRAAQPASAVVPEALLSELEAEANSWWQVKGATKMRKAAAQGALTILRKLRATILAAAPKPEGN